jgi:hypothetical protein
VRLDEDTEAFLCWDVRALDMTQRARHRRTSHQLASRVTGIDELADGYGLRLPPDTPLVTLVAEWVVLERLCCPFLTFDVRLTPTSMRLELGGPPGVKAFLRAELSSTLTGG